jgi:hypothetical protein
MNLRNNTPIRYRIAYLGWSPDGRDPLEILGVRHMKRGDVSGDGPRSRSGRAWQYRILSEHYRHLWINASTQVGESFPIAFREVEHRSVDLANCIARLPEYHSHGGFRGLTFLATNFTCPWTQFPGSTEPSRKPHLSLRVSGNVFTDLECPMVSGREWFPCQYFNSVGIGTDSFSVNHDVRSHRWTAVLGRCESGQVRWTVATVEKDVSTDIELIRGVGRAL